MPFHVGKDGAADVEVNGPAVAHDLADGQIGFVTEPVVSETALGVTGRKNERETRRERGRALAFRKRLKPVIEPDVFQALLRFGQSVGDCV